jgi:hypothetical protein
MRPAARLAAVTKRVRGPARAHRRPGTRPPTERSARTVRRRDPVTGASQLEIAEELAEEAIEESPLDTPAPVAVARAKRSAPLATSSRVHHKIKAGSLLATRAATEYVYVAQDMRRILVVAGLLIGAMFALWLLVVVLKVIPLPFY